MTMGDNPDLQSFRNEWKNELLANKHTVGGQSTSKSSENDPNTSVDDIKIKTDSRISSDLRDDLAPGCSSERVHSSKPQSEKTSRCCFEQQNIEYAKKKSNSLNSFRLAENLLRDSNDKTDHGDRVDTSAVIFDILTPTTENRRKRLKTHHNEDCATSSNKPKQRFLDIFLADLEEINEIPFFDHELPRELALKIFQHLDIKDLCNCSQVSRAWRSLAEDEYLWCCICQGLGYDEDAVTIEQSNWKGIAREHVMKDQTLYANWKERSCQLVTLQHAQGGVLCAVSSYQHKVAAGYTNGEVKFWDLETGDECTFQPSSMALMLVENEYDEGTLSNYVTNVAINKNVTMAGYSQGIVDIWSNSHGTQPCHSFRGPSRVTQLALSPDHSLFAAAFGDHLSVRQAEGDFEELSHYSYPYQVKSMCLTSRSASHDDHLLVAAAGDCIQAHVPGNSLSELSTLHHVVDHWVSCMDCKGSQLAYTLYSTGGPLEELFKLKLLDLQTEREFLSLSNLKARVICLNYKDSPEHMLITGNLDRSVRIYDSRVGDSVLSFWGHAGTPLVVQMDAWKAASGGSDGMLCIWDQRMMSKLWESHERHRVEYLHFTKELLVSAHIPSIKFPENTDSDGIQALRYRGKAQVFDFSATHTTKSLPSICLSSYDEPEAYNYNVRLAMPYDKI